MRKKEMTLRTSKVNMALRSDPETYYFRHSWFQLIRPMTLTGTISPLLAGTLFAAAGGPIRIDVLIALFTSALLIQMTTNMLNDFYDFRNGQDQDKWVTDSTKGVDHGPAYRTIPYVAGAMLLGAVGAGLWLAFSTNLWVMAVGIIGIYAGYAYSAGTNSFSSLGLGEFVAAIFLGPVVTILAYVVQGHSINLAIAAISLPFALLIASMVLTNNIRDIEKDRAFRTTLAIHLGRSYAVRLLATLLILPYFVVILLTIYRIVPGTALFVFLAMPVAFRLLWSFRRDATRTDEMKGMKWAARHHWAFGLLFALGWVMVGV